MSAAKPWITICHHTDLVHQSGVCALLTDAHSTQEKQIALFHIAQDQVYAIENWDPIGEANVLSRGLVGEQQGEFFVASPLFKHRFSLTSGRCLDDVSLQVSRYTTRMNDGFVQVQASA